MIIRRVSVFRICPLFKYFYGDQQQQPSQNQQTPFTNYSPKQKRAQKTYKQDNSIPFTEIPQSFEKEYKNNKGTIIKKTYKVYTKDQLSKILNQEYLTINDMTHFGEILKYLEANMDNLDDTNIMNVLMKFGDYLRQQSFVREDKIERIKVFYLKLTTYKMDSKLNLIRLLSLKLAKGVDNQFSLIICDLLNTLQETHHLTNKEVLDLFNQNFQIYYMISNNQPFIQEGKEITPEELLRIQEYEKTLPIPYEYEQKLISLLEYQLEVINQDYENLDLINKLQLCKIMKRTRIFNHSLTEKIIFDVQNDWKTLELQSLVTLLQAIIRSGIALPNELIYQIRDHFHMKDISQLRAKDTMLLLDVFVRSRLKFFDSMIERLFTNLLEENKFKYLALSDKVMSLYLYAKSTNFKNQELEKYLVNKQEVQIKYLSLIQIKIFLSSLAEMKYNDTDLFLRLKQQIDLEGFIGKIQEFAKLSPTEKEYFKMIIEILSSQDQQIPLSEGSSTLVP